jgi:hypothetical protein
MKHLKTITIHNFDVHLLKATTGKDKAFEAIHITNANSTDIHNAIAKAYDKSISFIVLHKNNACE